MFTHKDKTQQSPEKSIAFDPKSPHGAVIMDREHLRASYFQGMIGGRVV